MQIQPEKDEIQLCGVIPQCIQHRQEACTKQELSSHFLLRAKPQVLLFHRFDIIVRKADTGKQQRKRHACNQPQHTVAGFHSCGIRHTLGTVKHIAGDHRNHRADDKHEAAHDRRTLLILVPAGADFQNGLAEVNFFQIWNQDSADGACQHRRQKCS